jgi:phosphonate metabolism-associated iron-containing alcohol dehydrogenase
MENYNPTRVFFSDFDLSEISSFISFREKTLLVISETLLSLRPEIPSFFPEDTFLYSTSGSNPDLQTIDKVIFPESCSQVVGIGGGSKLDTAKALFSKLISGNMISLERLVENPHLLDPFKSVRAQYKLVLVPTTFGSSSEITKWGTLWDFGKKKKFSVDNDILYADTALIDPRLSLSAPKEITAYTGLDAFSHALESIWNKKRNFITVNFALDSIRLCIKVLPKLLRNLDSLEYRGAMSKACLLAGYAFSQTRTAAAHALSYPLTLFHNIPHGFACSITLGSIYDYNITKNQEGLDGVLDIFQSRYGDKHSSFQDCYDRFLEDCEVSSKLSEYGVKQADIPRLVDNAFHPDRFSNMLHNLSLKEVKDIYHAVL